MTDFQPLKLPPGFYRNGTPYAAKGRWTDGNFVRIVDNVVRHIGGWVRRTDQTTGLELDGLVPDSSLEAIRDTFAWSDLNQNINLAFGSNLKLWHLAQDGTLTDITPMGVTTSGKDASTTAGYGQNPYGYGAYGAGNELTGLPPNPPYRWAYTTFGKLLITLQRNVGDIYEFDPDTVAISVVTNAPTDCQDVLLTGPRILMTLGASGAPRLVKWSDSEDRNQWTAADDNEAGEFTIKGPGRLLRMVNLLDLVLILGTNDASIARYIGPPYVYSFDAIGENCGVIAAEAVAVTDSFAIWWSNRTFYMYDGSLREVPCDVIDFLHDDLDTQQSSKITAFTNQEFSEVWWLYQSNEALGEVDSYVMYDYVNRAWYTGRIDRTSGLDRGVTRSVIMVDYDGYIYNHELADVFPDGEPYIESGPIELGNGTKNMALRYVMPDINPDAQVDMTIYAAQSPRGGETTFGPYTLVDPTSTTGVMGRQLRFRFDLTELDAAVGTNRIDIAPMTGVR